MDNRLQASDERKKEKEIKRKVESYKGPEGLSTKKLNFGLWYVEHRKQFQKVFYGFLIAVGAVSWVYGIYGFAYYIARGMNEDELLAKQLVQISIIGHKYVAQIAAQELSYSPVQVLLSNDKRCDLVVQIENRNQKWWGEFNYYFLTDSGKTDKIKGFVLPNESKYLAALAQDFLARPTGVQLIVEDLKWSRVNQHEIIDWNDYRNSHLNIENKDLKYTPASLSELSDKIGLNQFDFTSTNKTPYNYWRVDYTILLYSGNNLVNINKYSLTDFMSGESRRIEMSWPGSINYVDRAEVIPEVNIMRDDIYIKFEGNGQEK